MEYHGRRLWQRAIQLQVSPLQLLLAAAKACGWTWKGMAVALKDQNILQSIVIDSATFLYMLKINFPVMLLSVNVRDYQKHQDFNTKHAIHSQVT